MYDLILSWVRTAVPAAVGSLIAWPATKGLVLDPAALGDLVNLGDDETIVEIPRDLVRFFDKE
ncbi:hypothetical protein ABZV14_11510 [Streptosporangium canum]|uniref:hypothetical protein n=1 Tax=Streptosporangium canum TaxID=324952 RepID=UPI0033B715F7